VQIGVYLYFGGHFGFKMVAIANQRWTSIRNMIIYLEAKFRLNHRNLVVWRHFGFKMTTIANKRWISNRNIIIYLETKFRPNRRIFVFWRPLRIQNGRHSKPTMDINSQHHNLLGSKISCKSEYFCILAAI
jgi:hypothetical protein